LFVVIVNFLAVVPHHSSTDETDDSAVTRLWSMMLSQLQMWSTLFVV